MPTSDSDSAAHSSVVTDDAEAGAEAVAVAGAGAGAGVEVGTELSSFDSIASEV